MELQRENYTQYYEEFGQGIPVLALPPFPFDHHIWREQRPLGDIARVITPDYRGVGQSTVTPGPYDMALLAEDCFRLLDHLNIDRVVVMGDSMGVYVAFAMYAQHPERIRGLIFADSRAEADAPEQAERRIKTVEGLRTQGAAMLAERISDLFSPTTRAARPALVEEFQQIARTLDPEGLAQTMLGMARRPDRVAMLPGISVPTLVVVGEDDIVSPPAGMRAMAAAIPHATFVVIPDAGHLAPLEQPEQFNAAVRDFLREIPA